MTKALILTSDDKPGGIRRAFIENLAVLQDIPNLSITVAAPSVLRDIDPVCARISDWQNISAFGRGLLRHLPGASGAVLPAGRFDVAIVHNGFLCAAARKKARRVIGICHNDKFHHFTAADEVICLTSKAVEKAKSAGWPEARLHLVPHYLDFKSPKPAPARDKLTSIAALGRLVAKKNMGLFIKAAAHVQKTHPHLRFLLAGDGPERAALNSLNDQLDQPVDFCGWVDMADFTNQIDLAVIPSLDEPFGYVLPEMVDAGIPVLASASFGPDFMLKAGADAPLFDPNDAESLAKLILSYADDMNAYHRLHQECQQLKTDRRFSRSAHLQKWADILVSTA